jgi:signal transduction histidine kinase
MDKSITLINHHLELHKVKLHKNYEEKYPVVLCNPQKIQQAFMALLINAIESMPDGGNIFIKINEEYEHILIRIIDEGMGIPEKDIEHIFEPFYSTKEASKGTGLGLSVTYGIITYHKGELKVESTSTKGTCFKIILPALNKFKGTDNGS